MKKTVLLVIVCCLFLSIGGCTSIKVEIKTDRNDNYVSLNSEESGKLLSLFEETEKHHRLMDITESG